MELMILNVYKMLCVYERTDTYLSLFGQAFLLTCYIWVLWYSNLSHIFLTDTRIPLKEREYLFESEIASYGRLPISIVRYSAKIICISLIWICYILSILIFATMGLVIIAILIVSFRFGRIPVVVKDISSALKTYYKESVAGSSSILNDK